MYKNMQHSDIKDRGLKKKIACTSFKFTILIYQ